MLLAPGALTTRMPRRSPPATSTLSTPVPARATMRRFGAASISRGVHFRRAADEQRVGVGQIGGERVGRPARSGVNHPAGFGSEKVEGGCGKVVGDDDFQCGPMLRT